MERPVVLGTAGSVSKDRVRLHDLPEPRLSAGIARVEVRVKLPNQPAICSLDLLSGRPSRDAKRHIVVRLTGGGHYSHWR
jgi:hypothetical protein